MDTNGITYLDSYLSDRDYREITPVDPATCDHPDEDGTDEGMECLHCGRISHIR